MNVFLLIYYVILPLRVLTRCNMTSIAQGTFTFQIRHGKIRNYVVTVRRGEPGIITDAETKWEDLMKQCDDDEEEEWWAPASGVYLDVVQGGHDFPIVANVELPAVVLEAGELDDLCRWLVKLVVKRLQSAVMPKVNKVLYDKTNDAEEVLEFVAQLPNLPFGRTPCAGCGNVIKLTRNWVLVHTSQQDKIRQAYRRVEDADADLFNVTPQHILPRKNTEYQQALINEAKARWTKTRQDYVAVMKEIAEEGNPHEKYDDTVKLPSCGHCFHRQCINSHIQGNSTLPRSVHPRVGCYKCGKDIAMFLDNGELVRRYIRLLLFDEIEAWTTPSHSTAASY